jgi:hypothetical protein
MANVRWPTIMHGAFVRIQDVISADVRAKIANFHGIFAFATN